MTCIALVLASLAMGDWLARPLGLAAGLRGLLHRLLLGLAACGTVVLGVGSLSLNAALITVILLGAAAVLPRVARRASWPHWNRSGSPSPLDAFQWIAILTIVAATGLALLGALAPVTSWDACVAHIALAKDYARQGSLAAVPGNEYTAYPHLAHTLFAAAYAWGGERSVAVFNWFLAVLALGALAHCGHTLVRERRCAWVAAAILASSPIFFDQAQAPSIDLAFTGFAVAALAALLEWHDAQAGAAPQQPRWLWVAALLAGASCGVRHTGYLVCALLWLGVVAGARERRLRTCALFALVAGLAAAPWLARSAWVTGNPVYPFLTSVFGAGDMAHWNVTTLATHPSARDTSLSLLLTYPWHIVMQPQFFDGWSKSPGGLVLILGIPGLFVAGRRARVLGLYAGAGMSAFFFFERLTRYVLPFLAPMMAVAAAAASRLTALRRLVLVVLLVVFGHGIALDAVAVHFKVRAALGLETREQYLTRRVERYGAFEWVNGNVPKDALVYSFDRRTYYFDVASYQNDEPLRRLQDQPLEAQLDWLRRTGIGWVMIPVTYMEEASGYRDSLLKVANAWRKDGRHFIRRTALDLPRPRGGGMECVEVYEVRHD